MPIVLVDFSSGGEKLDWILMLRLTPVPHATLQSIVIKTEVKRLKLRPVVQTADCKEIVLCPLTLLLQFTNKLVFYLFCLKKKK